MRSIREVEIDIRNVEYRIQFYAFLIAACLVLSVYHAIQYALHTADFGFIGFVVWIIDALIISIQVGSLVGDRQRKEWLLREIEYIKKNIHI